MSKSVKEAKKYYGLPIKSVDEVFSNKEERHKEAVSFMEQIKILQSQLSNLQKRQNKAIKFITVSPGKIEKIEKEIDDLQDKLIEWGYDI